jgi:hypothetical protein
LETRWKPQVVLRVPTQERPEAAKLCRMLWTLLALVAVVAWVVALVDIVRRRDELSRKQLVAWILLVVILPVVGTVLYFALGRKPAIA